MSAIKHGNAADFVWDIPTGEQFSTVGRNVSVNRKRGAEQSELPTDEGETDGIVIYNPNTEVSIEAIMAVGGLPSGFDPGTVLTLTRGTSTEKFLILEFSRSWTRKDWAKVSVTAKAWDAMTLATT